MLMEELCEMMEKCGCDVVLTASFSVMYLIHRGLTTPYLYECLLLSPFMWLSKFV